MPTLRERFRGCLLGAMIGDVAGAVVEAESPQYIAKRYRSVEEILAAGSVEEFTGPDWVVGRFTDDTQMTICVAEWLAAGEAPSGEHLLARFAAAYQPWRRYGPGTAAILEAFPRHRDRWRELATMAFPHGSYGNGSAMRVAPVGMACYGDPRRITSLAMESSRPTHSHPQAYQGATLQALTVTIALTAEEIVPAAFLGPLRAALTYFADLMQDISPFAKRLEAIEQGLADGKPAAEMGDIIGTGTEAFEAVPMALYCVLRHPNSFADAVREAIFLGGDTDTIASMTGAIAGAFDGSASIPPSWLSAVREDQYTPAAIEGLSDQLFAKFTGTA